MIKEKHKIFIPNPHGGKDIGIPLLKKIIRQIGITQDEFIKLWDEILKQCKQIVDFSHFSLFSLELIWVKLKWGIYPKQPWAEMGKKVYWQEYIWLGPPPNLLHLSSHTTDQILCTFCINVHNSLMAWSEWDRWISTPDLRAFLILLLVLPRNCLSILFGSAFSVNKWP